MVNPGSRLAMVAEMVRRADFEFFLPVPPSSNNLYFNSRHGRRLSNEGKAYKENVKALVVTDPQIHRKAVDGNHPWMLQLVLYMPSLENKGWPKTAENRYKKLDATNRIKAVEDALKDGLGIDDSTFLRVMVEKRQGPDLLIARFWDMEHGDPLAGLLP